MEDNKELIKTMEQTSDMLEERIKGHEMHREQPGEVEIDLEEDIFILLMVTRGNTNILLSLLRDKEEG